MALSEKSPRDTFGDLGRSAEPFSMDYAFILIIFHWGLHLFGLTLLLLIFVLDLKSVMHIAEPKLSRSIFSQQFYNPRLFRLIFLHHWHYNRQLVLNQVYHIFEVLQIYIEPLLLLKQHITIFSQYLVKSR